MTHCVMCGMKLRGGLSANEFATCLYKYLENCIHDFDKIIIYSDGCSYQNRNSIMATALRHFAAKHSKCIEQKFLEKGRTQMEVDSCHSKIEQRLKNRQIFVPADYVSAMEEARQKPFPYRVDYLHHDFFLNFASFGGLKSIRPGRIAGDPTVTNLKQLQYLPDGKIMFKLKHDDSWAPLPMKRGDFLPNASEYPSQLYTKQISVPKSKFDHLQQLKTVIPKDHHPFYDNLPYN